LLDIGRADDGQTSSQLIEAGETVEQERQREEAVETARDPGSNTFGEVLRHGS
jgi:hypothetical protein